MVERTITLKLKGRLKDINAFCEAIGSLSNDYNVDIEAP